MKIVHALALSTALLGGVATASDGLLDQPSGLHWSAREVQAAAEPDFRQMLERAERDGQAGCRRHCERLARVFDRLRTVLVAQGGRAARLPWQLIVLRVPGEQAQALPDGQIVISETFVDERLTSDATLAFVLAHEMAHSALEHERQTLTYALALLPRGVPRTVRDMYTEMAWNAGFLRRLAPISQQVEMEADEHGLLLAAAAGYLPAEQLAFMEDELRLDDGRQVVFATHPTPRRRLDRLRERLPLARRVWEQAQQRAGATGSSE